MSRSAQQPGYCVEALHNTNNYYSATVDACVARSVPSASLRKALICWLGLRSKTVFAFRPNHTTACPTFERFGATYIRFCRSGQYSAVVPLTRHIVVGTQARALASHLEFKKTTIICRSARTKRATHGNLPATITRQDPPLGKEEETQRGEDIPICTWWY